MTTAFRDIRAAAEALRGKAALDARLPTPSSPEALRQLPDDRYFSRMSLRIFSAGLKHSLVEAKWPAFEETFAGFDPARVAFFNDEDLDRLMTDRRLIRHGGKMRATLHNASAFLRVAEEHGSFGAYLAAWPGDAVADLWDDLGKRFKQLGGNSAPYFLRMVGKDTWTMSPDVARGLEHWEGLGPPSKSKKARREAQATFNRWAEETGLPVCQLSMILALSTA